MVPHFIGRQQECEEILRVFTSTSAQVVSVSGPPGFGKTSLAIAVGHQLRQLGLPVYFLSLRSVKTAQELISDLLNTFAHTSSDPTGRERSKLCGILSAIPSNICIILDNADDLFESSGETSQDVLDLLEKIFSHCKNVSFLLTTRTSLQSVLGRKFAGHTSVGVASLERKSSQMLVQQLVPPADESECCRVAEVCGDVPLAIKLLCGQIVDEKKSISQFLDNLSRSSKKLADLLDDPDAPNDQRLKVLFESYFKRLSREEQEAFVSLSVFVSEVFDEQAAVNVIGGDEDTAKKTLFRLKRKSLVEANSSEGLFSFHPLMT
jgi:AAA+ ATPase superfamily predicted ATPase